MSRSIAKFLAPLAVLAGTVGAASTASAADTTFASYTGTNGSLVAMPMAGSIVLAESQDVLFTFLNSNLSSSIKSVDATLAFTATSPSSDYTAVGKIVDQGSLSGQFLFTSTTSFTVGSTTYAAGTNLLTVSFTGADLYGLKGGSTASLTADTKEGSKITYTSAFLDFGTVLSDDFAISLSAVTPVFGTTDPLSGFSATPTGSFSSNPAPTSTADVPEPATWMLMLVGFGAIGLGARSSVRRKLLAA